MVNDNRVKRARLFRKLRNKIGRAADRFQKESWDNWCALEPTVKDDIEADLPLVTEENEEWWVKLNEWYEARKAKSDRGTLREFQKRVRQLMAELDRAPNDRKAALQKAITLFTEEIDRLHIDLMRREAARQQRGTATEDGASHGLTAREEKMILSLVDQVPELRGLYQQHRELRQQLEKLKSKGDLTSEEQLNRQELSRKQAGSQQRMLTMLENVRTGRLSSGGSKHRRGGH